MIPKTVYIPFERSWHDFIDDGLRHLGHGKALWKHKRSSRDIQIGDVGYFTAGHFDYLFNITLPRDQLGAPDGFEPIPFAPSDIITEPGCLEPDKLYKSPKMTIEKEIAAEGEE